MHIPNGELPIGIARQGHGVDTLVGIINADCDAKKLCHFTFLAAALDHVDRGQTQRVGKADGPVVVRQHIHSGNDMRRDCRIISSLNETISACHRTFIDCAPVVLVVGEFLWYKTDKSPLTHPSCLGKSMLPLFLDPLPKLSQGLAALTTFPPPKKSQA